MLEGYHNTDMHIHSRYSPDGEYAPSELLRMCADAGIHTMAIADHNCMQGAREALGLIEAVERKKNLRLDFHTAIEIDCTYSDIDFHVLGYDIDVESPDFEFIERNVRKQCAHASKERLRLINRLGFDISEAEIEAVCAGRYWGEFWAGEDFAEVLLGSERFLGSEILQPYRTGGSRSDNPYVNFYWDYFSKGKPCSVKMTYPEIKDVIGIIHKNGGKAVLAHPGVNVKGNFDMIDDIKRLGLDGIEAYSSYHEEETTELLLTKAREHNLFVTCGSDFHGRTKPAVKLGHCGA